MKYAVVVLLLTTKALLADQPAKDQPAKTEEHTGVLKMLKQPGDREPRAYLVETVDGKDLVWGLGFDDKRGTDKEGYKKAVDQADGWAKDQKMVVVTCRAGYFSIGNLKILLVLNVRLK